MTRQSKKRYERDIASACATRLGENWSFQTDDREAPDFLVEVDGYSFGLEVVQCFIGQTTSSGSTLRQKEAIDNKWLQDIRHDSELEHVPLNVRYLGQRSRRSRQELLEVLRSEDWGTYSPGDAIRRNLSTATVYITYAFGSHWECISNRVGWVSEDGTYLQACIDEKSKKLPDYLKVSSDSRLLVVADRIYNSGKLSLPDDFEPDLKGFAAVYFYSYPTEVTVYRSL